MEYIRKYYGVPAKRGGRIKWIDRYGTKWFLTIKSAKNGKLRCLPDDRIDGCKTRLILHPTWSVTYL